MGYLNVRREGKTCVLMVIGPTEDGEKKLMNREDGFRESGESQNENLWI